jgi:hypothetical protein
LKPQMNMKWLSSSYAGGNRVGRGATLGIAVGERAWAVAEVAPSKTQRGAWELRRVAEFVPPMPAPGALGVAVIPDAAAVGQALGDFLRQHEFAARDVVVGVPAKWLVARDREVPPAAPEQAAEILRLQAERSFSAELGELAFDYAGSSNASSPATVLLLAMPRARLDRVVTIAEAAGLDAVAVTPSTLALTDVPAGGTPLAGAESSGASPAAADGLVLNVTPDAVELSARTGGTPRLLRHLGVRGPDLVSENGTRAAAFTALAAEIRRTLAMIPGGAPGGPPSARVLQLWDGAGLGDTSALAAQVGVEVKARPGVTALRVTGPAAAPAGDPGGRFAPAVALALAGADRKPELVDFLHPRLAPPKRSQFGRREQWAAVAGGVLLLVALLFWLDLRGKEGRLAELSGRRDKLAPLVGTYDSIITRTTAANPWFDGRTPTLESLRELTAAFPDTDPIYVTTFTMTDPGTPTDPAKLRVTGRAPNDAAVLAVGDKLRANPKFSNVSAETRAAGGNSGEVVFTFVCNYSGRGPARPAAAARPAATTTRSAKPVEVRR